jgi:hypothetical protein
MGKRTFGWIGVDLDGTVAHYDGFITVTHIGPPVEPMVKRIQEWLAEGIEVRIFTARVTKGLVNHDGTPYDVELVKKTIQQWCLTHIGMALEVTNEKDFNMLELWDDRAVRVVENKGIPCCSHERKR